MKFTLVSTVFNEAKRIRNTLEDISKQSVMPDEIIITDAGSTDNTYEILNKWAAQVSFPVKILSWPKCNVAQGRNRAIAEASNEYIVSTDFGCRFHSDWFKSMTDPFKKDPSIAILGGAYKVLENEIISNPAKANYIICDGYYVKPYEGFIPSSRSIAYHKSVWAKVGGYPEWLTLAGDDLVFGMLVLKKGYSFQYVDKPYVYWGRHTTLKAYGKEAFRYGLGDGEAGVNKRQWLSKIIESAMRYLFVLSVLLVLLVLMWKQTSFSMFYLLPCILLLPGFRSYYWSFKNWMKLRSKKYDLNIFLYTIPVIELSRIQYIRGYISGYFHSKEEIKQGARLLKEVLR
jgi:glycosyltransferase involved in cell wall biosynthesis